MINPVPDSSVAEPPSHTYDLRWKGSGLNLVLTCGIVLLAGLLTHALLRAGLAPRPSFLSDPDSTIIATKAMLARSMPNAGVALVGDSSCLINLDVATLDGRGDSKAVNLGTLSYLGLDSFGVLAGEFARGKISPKVVLVVHPDCLRMTEPSAAHRAILEAALGEGPAFQVDSSATPGFVLGFDAVRARTTDRWIPQPLRGTLGNRYGFTIGIERELIRRGGTMDETGRFDPNSSHGSGEYRLAKRIKDECTAFRSRLTANARLKVIVSPVPHSHALKSHERTVAEMKSQLESWLAAESPSFELPLVLPDGDFGSVTHLLPEAAKRYSRLVGEQLEHWK